MPVKTSTLNKNLFDVLSSRGYDPVSLDSKGDPTEDIENADIFKFSVTDDSGNSVMAWATVEGNDLVLYTDDNFSKTKDFEPLAMYLKRWAQRRTLKWKVRNRDHLVNDMKKRTVMKKKEDQLYEGYHALGKKASYNDSIPQVKLILQHTRNIEEGEQRFRNIAKIFVENTNGERFLIPTNRPGLARVYARHIAEGGTPYDDKAKHITSLVEEYTKMAGFVRATRKGQFNESALRLVNEGLRHYNELRMTLQGMASHRGYNKYFESYTPVLNEESTEETNLNELFVQETLDPRIESVLPILNRLSKNITEMSAVKELDEWAQSITEVEDETTKTLAEPAEEMLDEAPGAETLKHNQNTEKSNLKAFDLDEGAMKQAMWDDAENMSLDQFTEKYGDDDFAKEFWHSVNGDDEEQLGEGPADEPVEPDMDADDKRWDDVEEGVVDTLKKVGKKVVDYIAPSDEELLKDLQKKIGIPKHAQHGKPRMAVPNDEVKESDMDEGLDANQKRAGQLGPTEPVGKNEKNLRGKLVGASESREFDDIKRLAGLK